jgi:transcriptional regulator with XRE-family HTH domain
MTQQALADAAGVTRAAVSQWEGGGNTKATPSHEHLTKVVAAFGLTMERFYGRLPKISKAS